MNGARRIDSPVQLGEAMADATGLPTQPLDSKEIGRRDGGLECIGTNLACCSNERHLAAGGRVAATAGRLLFGFG